MRTRSRGVAQDGFTVVELLVVVVVIGIIAAIAVPAYLNQREAARIASATSNLRTAELVARDVVVTGTTLPSNRRQLAELLSEVEPSVSFTHRGRIDEPELVSVRYRAERGGRRAQPASLTFMSLAGGDCRYLRVYFDETTVRHIESPDGRGRCRIGRFGRFETPSGW